MAPINAGVESVLRIKAASANLLAIEKAAEAIRKLCESKGGGSHDK
jgi:hypothetical protein